MSPTDTTAPGKAAFQSHLRQRLEQSAREERDDNKLWETAEGLRWALEMRFTLTQKPGDDLVPDLHDLWFTYYHASKNTSADSPAQDRLALQVVKLQARGALFRRSPATAAVDVATTSDGLIWGDLPFFVSDMAAFWTEDAAALSAAQRVNLAYFFAQLTAAGVAWDKTSSLALALFREALETSRPCGEIRGDPGTTLKASLIMADLTIADLLPAIHTWLVHAGSKIITLADRRWQGGPAGLGAAGALFCDDARPTTGTQSLDGFSPDRWIFWLRRLEAIASEADGPLAELATKSMDAMLVALYQSHSEVRRVFDAAPHVVKYRNMALETFFSGL